MSLNHSALSNRLFQSALPLLLLAVTACAPEEIKQYRVAKQSTPVSDTHNQGPLNYTIPAGWQKQPAQAMRLASFQIPGGGDVSVVSLPGPADLTSNVNRWRGQVGLAPVTDTVARQGVRTLQVAGVPASALELYAPGGKPDKAMRVMLFEKHGQTWFIKLAGPASLVKAQQQPFEAFARSLQISDTASARLPGMETNSNGPDTPPLGNADGMGANHPPVDQDMSQMPPLEAEETDTQLSYQAPGDWRAKPSDAMRIASFEAGSGGDVSIVHLGGDGGGLLENVNRWRRQLALAPIAENQLNSTLSPVTIGGEKGALLNLADARHAQGMLVALVMYQDQTWFIKMVGPAALIDQQRPKFLAFVQSIQFHAKGSRT